MKEHFGLSAHSARQAMQALESTPNLDCYNLYRKLPHIAKVSLHD